MTGQGTGADDADIDLKALFAAIWRKKGIILLAVAAAGAAAFAVTRTMAPLYHADAKVIIQPRDRIGASGNGANSTDQALLDETGVTSQVQVLKSTDLARDTIKKFKLGDRPEFGAAGKPSLVDRVRAMVGLGDHPTEAEQAQTVLSTFQDKTNVYKIAGSRVIVVQFSSQDPQLAADVPNAMVKDYLLRQSGLKLSDDSEAAAWLKPEIARLRKQVDAAESKVADFRADAGLLSVGNNDTLASRELGDMASELSKVRSQGSDAEARAANVRDALKNGRGVDTLANIVGSPLIQQLRQQEVAAQAQLADLSTSLGDRHPRIRALKSQIGELNNRIRAESRKVLDSLESEANIAKRRERSLTAQLDTLKKNAGRAGEQSVKLQALQREAGADRDLLNTYLARYRQASSRSTLNAVPADARIVSNAFAPSEPYFPKTVPIVFVAMVATFLLSAVIIILSELFSGRALRPVGTARHLEPRSEPEARPYLEPLTEGMTAIAAARVLSRRTERESDAATQRMALERTRQQADELADRADTEANASEPAENVQVRDEPDGLHVAETEAEAIVTEDVAAASTDAPKPERDFSIAAAASHLIGRKNAVVLCASPEGDAASAATVILTRLLAEQGAHVVLVDITDTGSPTRLMAQYKGLPGITDLLTGNVNFAESLHGDRLSPAHILPVGTADPEQAMRAADRLPIILDGLGDVYDFVLVECGKCEVEDIARLSRGGLRRDVLVTAVEPGNPQVEALVDALYEAGHEDMIVVVPDGSVSGSDAPVATGRSAEA